MAIMSNKEYGKLTKELSPPSTKIKDFIWAYAVGGFICVIGQLFIELYEYLGLSEKTVKMLVPVTLIFIAGLLTGLKLFDKIANLLKVNKDLFFLSNFYIILYW